VTERVGLIGWPVEHSVSPAMHDAAFVALSLDWHYDLLPIRPGELERELRKLIRAGYRGFNVTVPHKLAALELAQVCSEAAQAISATNTLIVRPNGDLHAHNTDAPGFWGDLSEHGAAQPPADALIMGTGGSARAVAHALLSEDWRVHILSREDARAEGFARLMGDERAQPLPRDELAARAPQMVLVVNCTPVGMWPDVAASPWPDDAPIPPSATVYDLVYNPARTALMAEAEAAGARAIGGLGMLVRQGVIAFELWTGQKPPLDMMRAAAEGALEQAGR
jgi:shikimate dehydrogenase